MSDFPVIKDHLVANPDKYTMTTNPDGTVTLRPTWVDNPSEVLQAGTSVDAAFLSKIPEAIDAIDTKVTSQLADIANRTVGYGVKSERPLDPDIATLFFLTDKKRRIEFNGSFWQYLDGSIVDIMQIDDGNIYSTSASYTQQVLAGNGETVYQNSIDMTKDFVFYTDLKLGDNNDFFNLNFLISGTLQFQLAFGYDWASSTANGSAVSVKDQINASAVLLGSQDLYTTSHKVVVWYDHKWGYLNVYIDKVLVGSWKPSAGGANIAAVTRVYGKAGSTSNVTLGYFYMANPLVVAIGDSITAGANFHAPNPDHYAGLDNYANNYPKMISDHLQTSGIKNYFLVNKGVNGETTAQMKSRFTTDVINKGCKYVMIHGGINDHATHGIPATAVQNKLDMYASAEAANIEPMLLGVIPTKTTAPLLSHQFSIDLHVAETSAYSNRNYVDLWDAIEGATTNVANDAKMADTVHPNITGYTAMAEEIKKFIEVG